jgi:hypothetical protein
MTARRSSATERRGVGGIPPRPAVLSAAVLAVAGTVALAGSGCASRNANTAGLAAPVNQDTGAPAKDGRLPHTPPAADHQAAHLAVLPTITELPSATSTLPDATTNPPTATGLGDTIVAELATNPLTVGLTPEKNPAAPKPVLEVVGMPTWLWVEGLPPALRVKITPAVGLPTTITVWAVMDKVTWSTASASHPAAAGPGFSCGNGTESPSPGKGYGIPYDLAFNPTASGVRNACVNLFTAPFYEKAGGPATAGVYNLKATVDWHIAYTDTSTGTTGPTPLPGTKYAGRIDTKPTQIRVGEIQALATTP